MTAKQIRQHEVGPGVAPLCVKAGRTGCEQRSAPLHEAADGGGLRVRQRSDVRENQHLHAGGAAIDVVGVDRQIRNARANQRVHETRVRRVDHLGGGIAPEEIGIALGPHDADVREGRAIDQVPLVRLPPAHHRLGGAVHATVLVIGRHVVPPRLNAAGDAGDHPHPRFRRGLARHAVVAGP